MKINISNILGGIDDSMISNPRKMSDYFNKEYSGVDTSDLDLTVKGNGLKYANQNKQTIANAIKNGDTDIAKRMLESQPLVGSSYNIGNGDFKSLGSDPNGLQSVAIASARNLPSWYGRYGIDATIPQSGNVYSVLDPQILVSNSGNNHLDTLISGKDVGYNFNDTTKRYNKSLGDTINDIENNSFLLKNEMPITEEQINFANNSGKYKQNETPLSKFTNRKDLTDAITSRYFTDPTYGDNTDGLRTMKYMEAVVPKINRANSGNFTLFSKNVGQHDPQVDLINKIDDNSNKYYQDLLKQLNNDLLYRYDATPNAKITDINSDTMARPGALEDDIINNIVEDLSQYKNTDRKNILKSINRYIPTVAVGGNIAGLLGSNNQNDKN